MLYNIFIPYISKFHFANLFHYITFRTGLATLLTFTITFFIGPKIIFRLKMIQKQGQPIRDYVPGDHKIKAGTPTMGGIMIIISTTVSTLLMADLKNPYTWICLFAMISFGALGFMDDLAKITKNNHYGVSGKMKLSAQFIVGLIICLMIAKFSGQHYSSKVALPFFKNFLIDMGYFYLPFTVFVIIGASNAVNLTDGLDGLAIVPVAIAFASFALICYIVGNSFYAAYLQLTYIVHAGEITVFCGAVLGASLGFLWYNAQPAEIWMGDTGSLSLGGVLGTISVITRHEIVLSIIGGLFVMEALSVIIQVYYFKLTKGKRIFKMAPVHHHFEKQGWQESKVVIRFWIIAVLFALIGLSSLKLR